VSGGVFMDIITILKNYNDYKAEIEILEQRIKMLKELLQLSDLSEYYKIDKSFFKKPLINRPTEIAGIAFDSDEKKKLDKIAREEIEIEIERLKSKIIKRKDIVNIIDSAFKYISDVEEYILKCLYFNKMTYNNILKNLQENKKFRNIKVWCIQTIINYKNKAIQKIKKWLGCYNQADSTPCF
jgi:archaellum component FlaC